MYDRKTNSYWSQLDGLAIVGELSGMELTQVSIDTIAWRDWKKDHPDSEVLSQVTGFTRPYGVDPYGGYYEDDFLFAPVENRDDRIFAKTVVFGVEVNGAFKAYREEDILESGVIEDTVGGVDIRIEVGDSDMITATNVSTGEEIVKVRGFWFAWYAFHPETDLYQGDS